MNACLAHKIAFNASMMEDVLNARVGSPYLRKVFAILPPARTLSFREWILVQLAMMLAFHALIIPSNAPHAKKVNI